MVAAVKSLYLDVPRVTDEDLENTKLVLGDDEEEALEEFEDLWKEFIASTSLELPLGEKGESIVGIEQQLTETEISKAQAQAELERQLEFFASSREVMEERYHRQIEEALKEQKEELEVLANILEKMTVSARNMELNSPWELFFDSLDDAVEQHGVKQLPGDGISMSATSNRAMKPSTRAMFLNHAYDENTSPGVSSRDYMIRAYKIDQALLTAEVNALHREIEQNESAKNALEFVGNLLTEHNIWGLLANPGDSSQTTLASTRRSHAVSTRAVPV